MRVEDTMVLFSIIEAQYYGGVEKWFDDGGNIMMLPPPFDEIVIVAPEGVQSDLLKELQHAKGVDKVKILSLPIPYPETSLNRIYDYMDKHRIPRLSKFMCGVLIISFNDPVDVGKVDSIKLMIENSKDIPMTFMFDARGIIAKVESKYYQPSKRTAPATANMEAAQIKRDTVITDDDLLNLKISLETMDVDAFINSL